MLGMDFIKANREAVERAMRDGHNGYAPSVGIPAAREAVWGLFVQREAMGQFDHNASTIVLASADSKACAGASITKASLP